MGLVIRTAAAGLAAAMLFTVAASAHVIPEGFSGFEDPAYCGGCHEAIYTEWQGGMHAGSSKFSDPLHAAVADAFSAAMKASGGRPNYHCANCHTPTADNMASLMKGEAEPDPYNVTNVRGVTCSFCHKAGGVVEGAKFNSYSLSEGIKGPSAESTAPHGAAKWALESPHEICLGCHGKMVGGKGGVICSMDEEGVSDCLVCHMPEADGPPASGSERTTHAFHGIYGAHDPEMLKRGAKLSLSAANRVFTVTVENPNPHYFPSTSPLRLAYLKVEAYDRSGKVVYENFKKDPAEDMAAVFIKSFRAGSRTGVPAWEAEGVARDSRLKPGEKRELRYLLPGSAVGVRARLYYRFIPPKAAEAFHVKPDGTVEAAHLVSEAALVL